MEFLTKNNIDKQNFSLFIRDLSATLNTNLKHVIEDTIKNTDTKKPNQNNKKAKKIVKKKKDIIIEEQNKRRALIKYEDDLKKINFLNKNKDLNEPFKNFSTLKTEKGIEKYKFILLGEYWVHTDKKKYLKYILILYFSLKDTNNVEYKDFVTKIGLKLENYEYKLYMFKDMGHLLPPLNFWDSVEKKLDDWQIDVVNHIKNKHSVLVKAPTSAGKTWIAMSSGIIYKKILYVCPAKPVAYQVGSHFVYMGYKVHYLVDDLCMNSFDAQTNIFVGTPKVIENNLYKIGNDFDYAVFDEIHNLDKGDDGDIYENLIKLMNCNFLALSATISNIDYLKGIFEKNNPEKKIHYIEYNKRFINHQRYVYKNNELNKLHPLCSTELKDLNDDFINNSLSYTPNDCAALWEYIEENVDDDLIEGLSPDEYFDYSGMLTLNDCLEYEKVLKKFILKLEDKAEVQELLNNFKADIQSGKNNIIDFLRKCKNSEMLPMIVFNMDIECCKGIFYDIYTNLHKSEIEAYPHHYNILEKKGELYSKYIENREIFKSKIKISKKSTDARTDVTTKMEQFDKKMLEKYTNDVNSFYDQCKNEIEKSVNIPLKKIQINNIQKEINKFNENVDFHKIDIFQKHDDFCFTMKEPMSGDTIKGIRREIMKTLNVKIPYEHPIFQMLKRGIGLYIESMPDEYNWILQKLMSNRDIGIVISDKTLCMGIDLPIRTSCMMDYGDNNYFTNEDYLQISGRAGRRGMDDRGNVIFYGDIDYLSLMKGVLPTLKGSEKDLNNNYRVLKKISKIDPGCVFNNFINDKRNIVNTEADIEECTNDKLLWLLRDYNSLNFVNSLNKFERRIFSLTDDLDKEIYLLEVVYKLIKCNPITNEYKTNKIETDINKTLTTFKDIYEVIINIFNNINKDRYLLIRKYLQCIHSKIRTIIIKYNGF